MRIVLLGFLALLAGCAWLRDDKGIFVDRSDDYLDAKEGKELVVPGNLSAAQVDDPFPIPPTQEQMNPQYYPDQPPQPDAIYATNNRDEVRIQRLGSRSWLVVPEAPTTVWPKLKQFLAENGVAIESENATYGRINTEWLSVGEGNYRDVVRSVIRDAKKAADIGTGRDRLLLRVEPGLRELTSEVLVRHENETFGLPQPDGVVDLGDIPSHIPQVETDMLNEIGAYIAARVAEQTVSMVAQEISAGVKSALDRDTRGEPVLRLEVDSARAWATVGQALARAEVDINDQDETTGVYHVTIPESVFTGEKPGWISRLFSFGGEKKYDLQLRVRPEDGAYLVSVMSEEGAEVDRELAQQVLIMIREFSS